MCGLLDMHTQLQEFIALPFEEWTNFCVEYMCDDLWTISQGLNDFLNPECELEETGEQNCKNCI